MQASQVPAYAVAAAISAISAGPAPAFEVQTFVSALNGNDANAASSCQRAAPCRTINVAMSNTTASGTVTMVDDGTYEPFSVLGGYITIEGQGPGTQINNNNNGAAAIVINSPQNRVTLRNFSIDGNRLAPSAGTIGIDIQGATSVNIENVTIKDEVGGSTPAGIRFAPSNSSELFVRNVSISGTNPSTGGGVVIGTNVSGVTYKVSVDGSAFDQNARGIVVQGPSNVQLSVSDTTVANATGNGIHVAPTAGTTKLTIADSRIVNSGSAGLYLAPTGSAAVNVKLSRSEFDNNLIGVRADAAGGAKIRASLSDVSTSNNTTGIYATGNTAIDVIRATVANNSNAGISMTAPAITRIGNSVVAGNGIGFAGPVSSYGNNQLLGNTTQGAKTPVAPGSVP